MRSVQAVFFASVLAAAAGCGSSNPGPNAPLPHAMSMHVTWDHVDVAEGKDLSGRAIDEVAVKGGEIVRIESDGPILVGERVRSGSGFAETWTTAAPQQGVITLRATLLATAILAPRGVLGRVHVGHGFDPGYTWFELESAVIDWADGPLPGSFPIVAPKERLDYVAFAEMDRVLADAVAKAKDPARALEAAKSLRRVAALRAVRALRPMEGFPYFYDHRVVPTNDPKSITTEDGHLLYPLSPGSSVDVTVEGPTMLDVWSRAVRHEDDEGITLEIVEGKHVRGSSSGIVSASKSARSDESAPIDAVETTPLHRALVHVPPGKHHYSIRSKGGTAYVFPLIADPVIHLGDAIAEAKDEEEHLGIAFGRCDAGDAPTICALALAMLGRDDGAVWEQSLGGASPEAKKLAEVLAAGGPRDPSVALEDAASNGDPAALAALGEGARSEIDDGLRGAWVRGTTHGTRWLVSDAETTEAWTSLLYDRDDDAKCAGAGNAPWVEVTGTETPFATTTWRGAPTLELLATASCDAAGPIALEVDGEKLAANPSSSKAKWHVLVSGKQTKVRRADSGSGHVYAIVPEGASCGAHWSEIRAPRRASTTPKLSFGAKVTAPGVEVWLRDGAKRAELSVTGAAGESAKIVVATENGFSALDKDGVRWTRVARLALPAWATKGVTIAGNDDAAVRAIVRAPRAVDPSTITPPPPKDDALDAGKPREAEPLDEGALTKLSREILVASGKDARAAAYFKRAMALAIGGASHAALEDARAALALGAKGPNGEDAVAYVRSAIRPMPKRPLALPAGVKAYGVEPDFDPSAPRCAVSSKGPRAMLASVAEELKALSVAQTKTFDAALAVKAFEAIEANPIDPRGESILARALSGSRWMTPKTLEGSPLRVQRPSDATKGGPIDPDGDLRARVEAGHPFDGSFAAITEGHPAKAILTGTNGAKGRVEFVCAARSPADALDGACPITVTVGSGAPIAAKMGADGHGVIELPSLAPKGKEDLVTISLGHSPGRWQAVARIVFDKDVPNGVKTADGWVLKVPGLQYRFLLKNGERAAAKLDGPTLVRVDALAEAEEKPRVVVLIDGKEQPLAVDGTPKIFAVPKGGEVTVQSLGGAATIVFAERIAKTAALEATVDDVEADPIHSEVASMVDSPGEQSAEETTAVLDPNGANVGWKDLATASDKPLTPLEEDLGTVTTKVMALTGTLRDGDLAKDRDSFVEQSVGYRRKIESIGLWTGIGAALRERDTDPSFALSALAYQEFGRLRIAGWVDYWGQEIGDQRIHTWQPRAFVEYSVRVAPNVFLLPRVGYDGFHTNLHYAPNSLTDIDDNVFNNFRARHPNEAFAQLLSWWVPYINDIFYLRARTTFDANLAVFDHVALRPGAFFALGDFELGVYEDTTWYRATAGIRTDSVIDVTGSGYLLYNAWTGQGSLDFQPGIGGRARTHDGGWEVFAMLNVFASFRRGLRDFTSLELNFPEPLGGGVAWRGAMAGGGR